MLTGIRRFELRALRWRDLSLVENVLRVVESKSEEGERTIALSPLLVDALAAHYQRTGYKGDDHFVFCHPERGTKIRDTWFAGELRAALRTAGITDYVRPFHDLRHSSLTNGAAAGEQPIALMAPRRASVDVHDEGLPAPGRGRFPRRGRRARNPPAGYNFVPI
jgi:integrase